MPAYGDDLAHIHDSGYTELADLAAGMALELLGDRGPRPRLAIELGSGSGRTARRLTDAGFDVLGFDLSPAMVELARATAPAARFEVASFLNADLPRCDAVLAVGEIFNYLFDPSNTEEALPGVFDRVRAALRPGGLFLFDLAGPGGVRAGKVARRHASGEDWAVLMEVEEDARTAVLTRRLTTFRRVGDLYRRDEEVHRLRLHRPASVLATLRRAGFRARVLRGYGGEPAAPGHRVFVARPRS